MSSSIIRIIIIIIIIIIIYYRGTPFENARMYFFDPHITVYFFRLLHTLVHAILTQCMHKCTSLTARLQYILHPLKSPFTQNISHLLKITPTSVSHTIQYLHCPPSTGNLDAITLTYTKIHLNMSKTHPYTLFIHFTHLKSALTPLNTLYTRKAYKHDIYASKRLNLHMTPLTNTNTH